MKILLHICCGPCAIYPVARLREKDYDVMGYFHKNNIHPYTECLQRQETLGEYADRIDLRVIYQDGYDLEGFLQKMTFREKNRCSICYHERLLSAAKIAARGKFDCFSSTLLYSKFQNHEMIRSIGESVGKSAGVRFYYEDFRVGWKEGIDLSKQMGMYRQQYCGCIYSEKERYYREA
jgi:predicted adenine nucleotide alpha hydrolase (AANH) superfamily ATPase